MIKVCHITSVHKRYDVRILEKECSSLAEKYEVFLIVCDEGPDEEKNKVQILSAHFSPRTKKERMMRAGEKIYSRVKTLRPDIVHIHDPELLLTGLKIKKRLGIKVIFDSHENTIAQIEGKRYIPFCLRRLIQICYQRIQGYVCGKIDGVITVDSEIEKIFKKVNHNTLVLNNYPILEKAERDRAVKGTIGFAGGVTEQWNHLSVLRVLANHDRFRYRLCGSADPGYLEKLRAMPGWKNVEFYGVLSHENAFRMLGECSVGVAICNYSSNSNGKRGTLGNTKMFEIMMAGIPVICSNFEVWREIVEGGGCGYCVEPGDERALTGALIKLSDNPELAEQMGANGRRLVEEKYHWGAIEKRLMNFYETIEEG